jgi:hypothetical protein
MLRGWQLNLYQALLKVSTPMKAWVQPVVTREYNQVDILTTFALKFVFVCLTNM